MDPYSLSTEDYNKFLDKTFREISYIVIREYNRNLAARYNAYLTEAAYTVSRLIGEEIKLDLSSLSNEWYSQLLSQSFEDITDITGDGTDAKLFFLHHAFKIWTVYIISDFRDIYSMVAYNAIKNGENKIPILYKLLTAKDITTQERKRIDQIIKEYKLRKNTKYI
jgi:hypothetical protein